MIIAIDAKKAFNKIQYLFMKKEGGKKEKTKKKREFSQIDKGHIQKTYS